MFTKSIVVFLLLFFSIISVFAKNNDSSYEQDKTYNNSFSRMCYFYNGNLENGINIKVANYYVRNYRHNAFNGPCPTIGDAISLGGGRLKAYQQNFSNGTPFAIGIAFSKETLSGLPTEPGDALNCYDRNQDRQLATGSECVGGHQRIMFLDANATPFKWLSVNWNPKGHHPDGVYSVAHFDFHFYMMDYISRNLIRVGPCEGVIDCNDFNRAASPVPPSYIHPDYLNVIAIESRMGNHLVDSKSPELNGGKFTHTFIFGSYDGKLNFVEPMVSLDYLNTEPNQCTPIKLPKRYAVAGYYPTNYCIRFYKKLNVYTIALEDFVYRNAN